MQHRPSSHVHWMVRDTAVAMAHELYDTMMLDNSWYKHWKDTHSPHYTAKRLEEAFVNKNLAQLIPQARAVLAKMLRDSSDPKVQESIYEALTLDATLIRGRVQ